MLLRAYFLLLFFCTTLIAGSNPLFAQSVTPTEPVLQSVVMDDELNFANLETALNRQLENFKKKPLKGTIKFGEKIYPKIVLRETVEVFLQIVSETKFCLVKGDRGNCFRDFNKKINAQFTLYRPVPGENEPGRGSPLTTFFTAYYSPDLVGGRVPTADFQFPLYKMPTNENERQLSREDIDFNGALAGKGLELFWTQASLFDLYLLHVQGGGRIQVKNSDGTEEKIYISFAGANGRKGRFIYHYMVENGLLSAANAGIDAQRQYLDDHPEQAKEILSSYASYVYFKETIEEPLGVENIPLTEGRSIAIDTTIYKDIGLLQFIDTDIGSRGPDGVIGSRRLQRFFLSQDTGGAIRGKGRCDLYLGYGKEAEDAAYNTKHQGKQFFLIKK